MIRARAAAVLAAALVLLPWSAPPSEAQSPSPSPSPSGAPSPPPFTVEVDVEVVSITAVVQDKAGHFIKGLSAKDVEVREDGVVQPVSYFREVTSGEARIPLSVVMVLDASGSMNRNMHFLQEAATLFIDKLEPEDSALIVQFNETIKGSAEFTNDTDRLDQFVEALQAWGGTSLYDAIHYGLGRVKDRPGRKTLVVFTDGADTTSTMKEQEVVDYARAVEATVYSVGIRGESGLLSRSPRGFLHRVAEESGGQFFWPDKVGDLVKAFAAISDELHNHYVLSYIPHRAPDGGWRTIDVRLKRPDLKEAVLRVRKGYFAVKKRKP